MLMSKLLFACALAAALAAAAAQRLDLGDEEVAAKCGASWCGSRRCVLMNGAGKLICAYAARDIPPDAAATPRAWR